MEHAGVISAATAPSKSATGVTKTPKPAAVKQAVSKNRPTNQHGTKTGPQKSRLDSAYPLLSGVKYLEKSDIALDKWKDMVIPSFKKLAVKAFSNGAETEDLNELLEDKDLSPFLNKKINQLVALASAKNRDFKKIRGKAEEIEIEVSESLYQYGVAAKLRDSGELTAIFGEEEIDILSLKIEDCRSLVLQKSSVLLQ